MAVKLVYKPFLLEFKHPFGVSSNTRRETPTVFVKLEAEGYAGYGEACLPAYLGETAEGTIAFFERAQNILSGISVPYSPDFIEPVLHQVDSLSGENNAAKAAIDIALHDLVAKIRGVSYRDMMGFTGTEPKPTSFTIGIDKAEVVEQKIREAEAFSILKIKAGTEDDKKLINLVRRFSDRPLYVDVNQGWRDKHEVLEMSRWMKDQGVILIEQPMPVVMKDEMRWVSERSPIPTIADESVKRLKDLESLDGTFAGINIKLMKCTGLAEANKMIAYCKKNNLTILLGCMAESSCAATAMAQLMQFADYIDLDAPLLYKNDPFRGITYEKGMVYLNNLPGIGVELIPGALDL